MDITLVLLAVGAMVTFAASRALVIHGLPVIEVNDPSQPKASPRGSPAKSWLGAIALPFGIVPGAMGIKMLTDRIGEGWVVLLLAGVLALIGVATYMRSGIRAAKDPAGMLVMRLMGCLVVVIAIARFGLETGIIVMLLAVWMLPHLVARYSQKRRMQHQ